MATGGGAAGILGGAAGAYAVMVNALKASGVIVTVKPDDFLAIVGRMESPVVVVAKRTFWSPGFKYLTGYKGLAFYCKSRRPIQLPGTAEVISAKKIWMPG